VVGWRPGQVLVVAASLVGALAALRALSGAPALLVAGACVAGGLFAGLVPVRGRALDEWVPAVASFAAVVARRLTGALAPSHQGRSGRSDAPPSRGFRGLVLEDLAVPGTRAGGPRLGVVHDLRSQTLSAVLPVASDGFALLGEGERQGRIAAWAGLLESLVADSPDVHRLQWVARARPGTAAGTLRLPGSTLPKGSPPTSTGSPLRPLVQAYRELVAQWSDRLPTYETYLVVTVRAFRRATPLTRFRGAGPGEGGRVADKATWDLLRAVGTLVRGARSAGLETAGALSAAALAAALRAAFDVEPLPWHRSAWPLGVEERWAGVRVDGTWHATYWVSEWPRGEVGSTFLLPVLLGGTPRRTFSLTMAPRPALAAQRAAEHARTTGAADAELRRRHGFAITARARGELDAARRHEEEVALGHGTFSFSAYLSVCASSPEALEDDCRAVEQAAARSQLELRRLYGSQAEAFTWTLPCGRGLS
jgi:hypothetical protein